MSHKRGREGKSSGGEQHVEIAPGLRDKKKKGKTRRDRFLFERGEKGEGTTWSRSGPCRRKGREGRCLSRKGKLSHKPLHDRRRKRREERGGVRHFAANSGGGKEERCEGTRFQPAVRQDWEGKRKVIWARCRSWGKKGNQAYQEEKRKCRECCRRLEKNGPAVARKRGKRSASGDPTKGRRNGVELGF